MRGKIIGGTLFADLQADHEKLIRDARQWSEFGRTGERVKELQKESAEHKRAEGAPQGRGGHTRE